MNDDRAMPSTGYVTDAASNNAEILYGPHRPTIAALTDLINIVQCAVMNDVVVASPMAIGRSSLLGALDCAGSITLTDTEKDGEAVTQIDTPLDLPLPHEGALIDVDAQGEPCANFAAGELVLVTAWSEMLQDDPVLGSLVLPERLDDDQPRSEAYFVKFLAFMAWLLADRGVLQFDSAESRRYFAQSAEDHLTLYRRLARRLVSCRDRFGFELTCSVIEEPLFSLSVAQEVNAPLDYLEQFDAKVHAGITAARGAAFERWQFPAVGAAVLGRCASLDDLPGQIGAARDKLLKARNQVRGMNQDIVAFEHEMQLGNDAHFQELNRLKLRLQRALRAFGEDTAYRAELEAFPVSERVWWLPKILKSAKDAMGAPEAALAEVAALPWVQRQRFLRHVPGMRNAASYVKRSRAPLMQRLIGEIARLDFDVAGVQSRTLDWAADIIQRCCDLRSTDRIEPRVLFTLTEGEGGAETDVGEHVFWWLMLSDDSMRESFFFPTEG